ncbi:enoyl-ACP reductase FabI [Svornostia abyssi]|uniref:Enoyl-[acyl-carrier-protein] reductase [NADH] n=1 Tax=Svornostia abyssi TaxID=2898438 RepID=A0ABY5PN24_9ACTN|nr:enoyl-ACP reductase FabI [Parviterribacteraceae bacterium J379]
MLSSKRLLITGLVTTDSIAFAVAERAQLSGATVLLSALGRDLELAEAAAAKLPRPAELLELDVTRREELDRARDRIADLTGGLDGALHAVAFAPRDALGGDFLDARPEGVELAFRTSAWSLAGLAGILRDLAPADGGALVGLDFDADGGAWPVYNWMGVCKAALQSTARYLARDLGPRGIRVNLVAAGPLHTRAAGGIPGFEHLLTAWERQAPLGWDPRDAGPSADAVCFLLSDWSRAVTGEILHADGGFHAMASPPARETTSEDDRGYEPRAYAT